MADEKETEGGTTALATRYEGILDIESGRARANLKAIKAFQAVVREVLTEGTDYGTIPGCGDKPSLFKPGAEKITKLLNLFEDYEFVERLEDFERPLFHYVIRCTLRDIATGTRVASGLGACNSRESKYRYRWIPEELLTADEKLGAKKKGGLQTLFEPKFAINKKETAGKYGKPPEHWAAFDKAIADKTARAVVRKTRENKDLPGYEMDIKAVFYQVENPDIFDQVNTIIKIGKKRSHVDATLAAGRLSELFTQDLEDLADDSMAKEERAKPEAAKAPAQKADRAAIDAAKAKAKPAPDRMAKTVNRVQDEWDPEAPPPGEDDGNPGDDIAAQAEHGPEQGQPALRQLEQFAKAKSALAKLGVNEAELWEWIHKFTAKTYKVAHLDLADFAPDQIDGIVTYLGAWKKNIDEKRAAKAAQEKAREES